jgi:hypothetical protein
MVRLEEDSKFSRGFIVTSEEWKQGWGTGRVPRQSEAQVQSSVPNENQWMEGIS